VRQVIWSHVFSTAARDHSFVEWANSSLDLFPMTYREVTPPSSQPWVSKGKAGSNTKGNAKGDKKGSAVVVGDRNMAATEPTTNGSSTTGTTTSSSTCDKATDGPSEKKLKLKH
jgi:hypothetical protein